MQCIVTYAAGMYIHSDLQEVLRYKFVISIPVIPTFLRGQGCEAQSQWSFRLRHRSVVAGLLRWWFRKPPGAWTSVVNAVLSRKGLCDELITRPEESYRLWCVVVCDLATSWMRRPEPTGGCWAGRKKDARTHDYFSKPKGVREQKSLEKKTGLMDGNKPSFPVNGLP